MSDSVERENIRTRPGWIWVLALGLVLIAAGIIAIFQPIATSLATGIILAWLLVASGVFAIIAGIRDLRRLGGWVYVLLGVLAIVAGIIVMLNPFAGAWSLVWAIGIWLVVTGILQLVAVFQSRRGRFWLIFFGLVDVVLGILLMAMDPLSALFFLAIFVGISFLIRGVGAVAFAFGLRRLSRA